MGTGVRSIGRDAAAGMTTVPITSGATLPGDVERVPFDLLNDGDVPLSSVVDHLPTTVSFPGTAGSDLACRAGRMVVTFTAAQRDGAAR